MKGIIKPRLKEHLLRRDGNKCFYCDDRFEPTDLTMEHVLSDTDGGPSTPSNLVLACGPCNKEAGCLSIHGKIMLRETKIRRAKESQDRDSLIQRRQQLCKEKTSISKLANSKITDQKAKPSIKARLTAIDGEIIDLNVKLGFDSNAAKQNIAQAMLRMLEEIVPPEEWEIIRRRAGRTIKEYQKKA